MAYNNGFPLSGAGAGADPVESGNSTYDNLWKLYLDENPPLEDPELLQVQDPNDIEEEDKKFWDKMFSSGEPVAQQAVPGNGDDRPEPEVPDKAADATQTGLSATNLTAESPETAPLAAIDEQPVPQDTKTSIQDDTHSAFQDEKSGIDKVGGNDDDVEQHSQDAVGDADVKDPCNKSGNPDTSNDTVDKPNDPSLADSDPKDANDDGNSDHESNQSKDESTSNSSYDRLFDEGPRDEHDAEHGSNASGDESSKNSSYNRIFGEDSEDEDEHDTDHESNESEDASSSNSSYDRVFDQGPEDDNTSVKNSELNQQTIINVFQSTDFNKKFNKLFDNDLSAHFHEVVDGVGTWSEDEERTSTSGSPTGYEQPAPSAEEPPAVRSAALHQSPNDGKYQIQHRQSATQPPTTAYNGDPIPQHIGGVFNFVTHRFSFDIDRLNARFVLSRILWAIISGSRLIGYANWSTQSFFDIFANTWVHLPSPINRDLNSSERFRPFRILEKNSIAPRYRNALTLVFDEYAGEMLYKLASFVQHGNPPLGVPALEDNQNFFDFDNHDQAVSLLDPAQAATDANSIQSPSEGLDFGTMYTETGTYELAADPVVHPFADVAAESVEQQATNLFAEPASQNLAEPIAQQFTEPNVQPLEGPIIEPTTHPAAFAQERTHESTSQAAENWIAAPSAWPIANERSFLPRPSFEGREANRMQQTAAFPDYRHSRENQSDWARRDMTAPIQRGRNDWQRNFAPVTTEPSTSDYASNDHGYDYRPPPSQGLLDSMVFARISGVHMPESEHYQQEIDDSIAEREARPQARFLRRMLQVPEATGNSPSESGHVSRSSSESSSKKRKSPTAPGADDFDDDDYNEDEAAPSPPKRRSPAYAAPLTRPPRRRRRAETITREDGTTFRRNANGSIPIPGAPRGRASAWSEAEDDFAIQFVQMIKESDKTMRIDDLWVEAAERMQQMGFNRSADSIKNQWNRRLRAKSGYDERATPRSDAMTTGELGTDAPKVGRVRRRGPRQ